jgi:signal transduction histidine kinase
MVRWKNVDHRIDRGGGKAVKKCEILIALSNEDTHNLTAISSALEYKGCKVSTSMNSESAVEALYNKDFDLVITDLLDILKKAKEVNPETMVIILTNNYKLTFVINALRLGANDYIIKPLDMIELWHLLTYFLKKLEVKRRSHQMRSHERILNEKILNMLKIMSHDIKGSLVSMSAILKLLNRGYYGKMDEGVTNSLKELLSKTTGLIGITEEYLSRTFSLNGDLEAESEALDLMQDIISPILEELSPELKDHQLLIDNRFDAMSNKPIFIKANRIWLKTIFRNLLRNAIKYGDKGCTVALGCEDHGSSYRLNVYNSGKPIPEEYRDKLFSKFMRIGNNGNGSRGADSMGLGLYLIKKIIQKQGGDIWYEAKEDGSNFVFTLPSGLAFSGDSLLPIRSGQLQLVTVNA